MEYVILVIANNTKVKWENLVPQLFIHKSISPELIEKIKMRNKIVNNCLSLKYTSKTVAIIDSLTETPENIELLRKNNVHVLYKRDTLNREGKKEILNVLDNMCYYQKDLLNNKEKQS